MTDDRIRSRRRQLPPEPATSQQPGTTLSILLLFGFLGFVFAFASMAGFVTAHNVEGWYAALAKPPLTPANWVFPVVWNFLYFLMGLSGWLVWRKAGGFAAAAAPLILFALQITLNFTWSVVFFGLHSTGGAVIEIFVLIAALALNILFFWRVTPLAAILMLPYLAWTLFASYLTIAIWLINA